MDEYIDSFVPASVPASSWMRISPVVRELVKATKPRSVSRARDMIRALAGLAYWATEVAGYDLEADILLHRAVIALYIEQGTPALNDASRGNRSSVLLRIAEANAPVASDRYVMPKHGRSTASAPYGPIDLALLRSWASGHTTTFRQQNAQLMLGLGAGAGLSAGELIRLRLPDITVDAHGILVRISGTGRPDRTVPVLATWEDTVRAGVGVSVDPTRYLFRSNANRHENLVNRFTAQIPSPTTARGRRIPVTMPRLRATWIVTHLAAGTPGPILIEAAGVDSFRALERHLKHVPDLDPALVRSRLREPWNGGAR